VLRHPGLDHLTDADRVRTGHRLQQCREQVLLFVLVNATGQPVEVTPQARCGSLRCHGTAAGANLTGELQQGVAVAAQPAVKFPQRLQRLVEIHHHPSS
jgi:hypothetical protein